MSESPHPVTNRQLAQADTFFRRCCAAAGVDPTRRQASKFRRRLGRAWAARMHVTMPTSSSSPSSSSSSQEQV